MTPIDRSIVASVTVLAFEFFAGIMIWSTALGACGVPSVSVFSEIDPDAILVSTCHHPAALSLGDIEELTLQDVLAVVDQYPNALVTMVGGPPCTDVSLLKHDRQGAFGVCSRLRENFRRDADVRPHLCNPIPIKLFNVGRPTSLARPLSRAWASSARSQSICSTYAQSSAW